MKTMSIKPQFVHEAIPTNFAQLTAHAEKLAKLVSGREVSPQEMLAAMAISMGFDNETSLDLAISELEKKALIEFQEMSADWDRHNKEIDDKLEKQIKVSKAIQDLVGNTEFFKGLLLTGLAISKPTETGLAIASPAETDLIREHYGNIMLNSPDPDLFSETHFFNTHTPCDKDSLKVLRAYYGTPDEVEDKHLLKQVAMEIIGFFIERVNSSDTDLETFIESSNSAILTNFNGLAPIAALDYAMKISESYDDIKDSLLEL